jgi:Holliday junction DNA helicase RuvB
MLPQLTFPLPDGHRRSRRPRRFPFWVGVPCSRWSVQEELLPPIAQRSRGTPRLALRLLQSCRRVCRAESESTITIRHLQRACELEQIDVIGLGPTEQLYLRALADGASRLNVIGSILGSPAKTVSQVVEPFLLRSGLIVKDDSGRRELTAKGREHLSRRRLEAV